MEKFPSRFNRRRFLKFTFVSAIILVVFSAFGRRRSFVKNEISAEESEIALVKLACVALPKKLSDQERTEAVRKFLSWLEKAPRDYRNAQLYRVDLSQMQEISLEIFGKPISKLDLEECTQVIHFAFKLKRERLLEQVPNIVRKVFRMKPTRPHVVSLFIRHYFQSVEGINLALGMRIDPYLPRNLQASVTLPERLT